MNQEPINLIPNGVRALLMFAVAVAIFTGATVWFFAPAQFFSAYLAAYLLWLGISIGSLGWMMIHHMVGGGWGRAIQRIAEAAALNLPLMLVLFLPILLGLKHLYPWADPAKVADDLILQHRSAYMNSFAFFIRVLVYFGLWIAWAVTLVHASSKYDVNPSPNLAGRMLRFSAAGLVIYILSMTLASVDWIMSREPHWFSTIFGFIMVIGQGFSSMLFLVVVLTLLLRHEPLKGFVTRGHYNDLGNLMLTLVILWAYVGFSQFLISWTGNIKDDVNWYHPRTHGLIGMTGALLILLHFFAPFFILLSKDLKRNPRALVTVAAILLALRFVDLFWMLSPGSFLLDLVMTIGIGAIWMLAFERQLRRRPLLAVSEHEQPSEAMEDDSDPEVGPHGTRHAHPA